ncbi:patatin-like phospholipase family protein [Limnobacter litoralis]|uniref:Cyclic nucleotide-binding protein n=1 Tax=Limnobacter litoralis TaxID=481366 RepID=A0ABQ5YQ90_9BURK|nr:patatin-like phospholipase family protein [Limnobacter litoralis]GLR26778.1 cyclic nucleotide-binding protein [Limnobacter litoralis]
MSNLNAHPVDSMQAAIELLANRLDLKTEDAGHLLAASKLITLERGQRLFEQGDHSESFYIVLKGQLLGQRSRPDGFIDLTLSFFPGEIIGELGFFDHSPRTLSVHARRDSHLLEIDGKAFEEYGKRSRSVYNHLIRVLVSRFKRELGYSASSNQHQFVWFQNLAGLSGDVLQLKGRLTGQLGKRCKLNTWTGSEGFTPSQQVSGALTHMEWIESADEQDFPGEALLDDLDGVVLFLDAQSLEDPAVVSQLRRYHICPDAQIDLRVVLLHRLKRVQPQLASRIRAIVSDRVTVLHLRTGHDQDLVRVARHILGDTLGLVLGGGGARGFAHAGFYRALHEHGVVIDSIGGTSMGALVGALIASGLGPDEVDKALALSFRKGLPFGLRDYLLPRHGLIRSASVDNMYRRAFGQSTIEDQLIPFYAVSCNLTTGNQHLFDQGELWQAVRASTSIPVFFEPCVVNNHILVDGALLNNVPVDFMRARGVRRIVSVDVGMEADLAVTAGDQPADRAQLPTVMKSLMRVIELGGIAKSRQARSMSDVYVQPPIEKIGLLEFERRDEVIALGYEAGLKAVQNIRSLYPEQ